MTVRVLLADDQPLLLHGFSMIINAQPDLEVVGVAHDGAQVLALVPQLHPDVVLMDIRMPVLDGIEATRRLCERHDAPRVLVLTTFDVDAYAVDAVRAGASGFLLKNARPDELLAGIRAVAAGDAVLAPSTTRRLLHLMAEHPDDGQDDDGQNDDGPGDDRPRRAPVAPVAQVAQVAETGALSSLTSREQDVFHGLAAGLSNAEIAARLVLAETTVKTHVVRILAKLQLRDRVQAVIFAYERGLTREARTAADPRPS